MYEAGLPLYCETTNVCCPSQIGPILGGLSAPELQAHHCALGRPCEMLGLSLRVAGAAGSEHTLPCLGKP